MIIRWSSATALRMQTRLDGIRQELQTSLKRLNGVMNAIREADPSNEDRALLKLQERCAQEEQRMRRLQTRLEEYSEAIKVADARFCDAEQTLKDGEEELHSEAYTPSSRDASSASMQWSPAAYSPMPSMQGEAVVRIPVWYAQVVQTISISNVNPIPVVSEYRRIYR